MADLLNYDASQMLGFILVLIRIGGIMLSAPVLGSSNIPPQAKIAMALGLALIVTPFVPRLPAAPNQPAEYVLLIMGELLIGLVLGFLGRIMFAAVEFAGSLIGLQMGLSMANVFDPQSQQQVSLIGQFENIVATLVFLVLDGHLMLIQAMIRSYEVLPAGGAQVNKELMQMMVQLTSGVFSIGFQLGAPLIVSLFLANLIIALLSRAVPQIQVFVVGFPLTLMLGFLFLMLGMPFFVQALRQMFGMLDNQLLEAMRVLALPGS
jgi:flagellar biosynthetic protein FliR